MGRLKREDTVKNYVSQTRASRADRFSQQYNYYDGDKHNRDYLYPCTKEVLGTWKHFNLSKQTLMERNKRDTSPLMARELTRYNRKHNIAQAFTIHSKYLQYIASI